MEKQASQCIPSARIYCPFLSDFIKILYLLSHRGLLFFDIILVYLLFQISLWLSPYEIWGTWRPHNTICSLVYSASFVLFAFAMGFYERAKRYHWPSIISIVFSASVFALIVSLIVVYFSYYDFFGRLTLIYGFIGSVTGTCCIHLGVSWLFQANPYRFSILGESPLANKIREHFTKNSKEYKFIRYFELEQTQPSASLNIVDIMQAKLDHLVLSKSALDNPSVVNLSLQALQNGLRVTDDVTFFTSFFEKIPIDQVSKNWVIHQGIDTRPILSNIFKRSIDILISLLLLVLLSPLFLLITISIKLTSKGPIFFNQIRSGQYCNPFNMYKFRTMRSAKDHSREGFTLQNDKRISIVGKVLRPLHLDELPQLWNIVRGKMSLVGPRPEAIHFAHKMRKDISLYDLRYLVRPGLTGHAQIHQGYAMDSVEEAKEKLAYDLYYISRYSFWLDVRIILRTLFCLVHNAR